MAQDDDWPLFRELLDRLDSDALTAARDIIGRGRIPVTAIRSDIPGRTTPEPVEDLLRQARKTDVWLESDAITAYYGGDQDRRRVLGPHSNLQSLDVILAWSFADRHRLYLPGQPPVTHDGAYRDTWAIGLRNCRGHLPLLAGALTAAGCRVKGRRPGSEDGEKSAKDLACNIRFEIPAGVESRPEPNEPEPAVKEGKEAKGSRNPPRAVVQRLANFIFELRAKETREQKLLEMALGQRARLDAFTIADFSLAYRRVYQTEPHRPKKGGWPLQLEFAARAAVAD